MEIKTSTEIRLMPNVAISNMRDFDDKKWVSLESIKEWHLKQEGYYDECGKNKGMACSFCEDFSL